MKGFLVVLTVVGGTWSCIYPVPVVPSDEILEVLPPPSYALKLKNLLKSYFKNLLVEINEGKYTKLHGFLSWDNLFLQLSEVLCPVFLLLG